MNLKSCFGSKYPSNALNIAVGFDNVHKIVKFCRVRKLDFSACEVREYPYTQQFLSEEFLLEFKDICAKYIAEFPSSQQLACYLMLPDSMIAMDNVTLPQMKRDKLNHALNTELSKLYKNHKELQFKHYIISSDKQCVTFLLTIVKKHNLAELYRVLAENKFYAKGTTYQANCLVGGVLHLKSAYRKKSFLFLDIHSDYTNIAVCAKGRTAGFATLMLGADHLSDAELLQEHMLYNHDFANLAVINAQEKARMKALTVADELETPRRILKLEHRQEPVDSEGFIYENFRMFLKWALLYERELKGQAFMPKLDCVLVNMPKKYSFVIDKVNAEKESGLPFEYLGDFGEKITENLDVIGALYCGVYNKSQNF